MGVKAHYIYYDDETLTKYLDIRAYFRVKERYQWCKRAYPTMPDFKFEGGWRKCIEPLFTIVKKWYRYGHLQKLKTANPYKDPTFRSLTGRKKVKKKAAPTTPPRPAAGPPARRPGETAFNYQIRLQTWNHEQRLRDQAVEQLRAANQAFAGRAGFLNGLAGTPLGGNRG